MNKNIGTVYKHSNKLKSEIRDNVLTVADDIAS